MLVPARKIKAGAQKWVIQRVKKMPGVGPPAGSPEKTRTGSIAMMIMTAPRMRSMEAMREVTGAETGGVGLVMVAIIVGLPECWDFIRWFDGEKEKRFRVSGSAQGAGWGLHACPVRRRRKFSLRIRRLAREFPVRSR